jgi:hypothetical protein
MNIFTLSDDNNISDKINLDDLYEKKRELDEGKLQIYNKILNRIHAKIKTTSRQQTNEQFCWYIIPEMMIGITKYNVAECTGYIIEKLKDNGFLIRYTHPNLVFISWKHWIPGYVRQEFKKKTGVAIDGYGNTVNGEDVNKLAAIKNGPLEKEDPMGDNLMFNKGATVTVNKEKKDYKSTDNYKPLGIYNSELFRKIKDKFD